MIDTHCHLGDPSFSEDLEAVVARARAAGVSAGLCILSLADGAEESRVAGLAERWSGIRFAVGLHPHEAHRFEGRVAELVPALDAAWTRTAACAVGEIGLDYHYDLSPRELQREVFAVQVEYATTHGRPIIIHTREADADTVGILKERGRSQVRGVFHCFSGGADLARAALELGFYLSFSGILTFPKADLLREVAAAAPRDRILVETDCPYLAPVPLRGKRNEPAFVVHTAAVLARVLGLEVPEVDRLTTENASRLFGDRAVLSGFVALTPPEKYGEMNKLGTSTVEKSSVSLSSIFEPVRLDLERVEREYISHLDSKVALIPEIGKYIQTSGGKRVRPAVLLMAARLCGYTGDLAVLYASVVEFIHTATLVHDDVIDEADLRRGRQAVHSRWGNDITVLLGDYLYIKSMALALTQDALEVIRLLCDITLRMIEGELYQLTKNGDVDISEDEHFEIIHRKTAFLFAGCSEIGGILGKVSPERQKALHDYGFNLGVAFQVVDDLLDLTGTEQVIGKPVASDLREGKVTLPLIFAMKHDGGLRDLVAEIVRTRDLKPGDWQTISRRLTECRAIDYAMEQASGFARKAQVSLEAFPPSLERDALMALPDYVLSRDR